MRRVSIGLELIAAPDILILDEPTSVSRAAVRDCNADLTCPQGLDSVSAANVISVLQNLARDPTSPTTIVASIHQPSSRLYQSFDTVLLLSDGKPLYFGPGGAAPASYFASKGYPCPEGYNVADHLLEIASAGSHDLVSEYQYADTRPRGPTSTHTDEYLLSPIESKPFPGAGYGGVDALGKNDLESSRGSSPPGRVQTQGSSAANKACATTFLTQFQVLSGREWRNLKR